MVLAAPALIGDAMAKFPGGGNPAGAAMLGTGKDTMFAATGIINNANAAVL